MRAFTPGTARAAATHTYAAAAVTAPAINSTRFTIDTKVILDITRTAYSLLGDSERERTDAMAKKTKSALTVDAMKPYVERALTDPGFRKDLKDAVETAKELYGPLTKSNGVTGAATMVATDKKTQKQLQKALDDIGKAAGSLKGKKKSHKGRNTVLLAGVVAGALYNPWTGAQTRKWILDKVAGDDDLQPLEGFEMPATNGGSDFAGSAADAAADAADAVGDAAGDVADAVKETKSKGSS